MVKNKLNSIVQKGKSKGKTILYCLDTNFYAWRKIIETYPQYYDEEVFDYINSINSKLYSLSSLNKEVRKLVNRDNT